VPHTRLGVLVPEEKIAQRNLGSPSLLLRFGVGLVVLTGVSAAYTLAMTLHYHSQYPWGMQLFWGEDFGWDFLVFRDRFLHFRAPDFWQIPGIPLTYPAAVGVVFGMLYKFAHPVTIYLSVCAAAVTAWAVWLIRRLIANGIAQAPATVFVFTIAATCWPLWVLLDTANIEGLVVILTGSGILALVHRRWWLAAALIGIAGAMKIFPLALFALLLSKRRYKEFSGGIVIALVVTLASLAILGPSIPEAQRHINSGLRVVTSADALALTSPGPDTNHSLYIIVRYAVMLSHHRRPHASVPQPELDAAMLRPAYFAYLMLGGIAAVAVYVLRLRHLPMLNQILAITICAVMLPPLSRDYTLLHLLVPLGLLCGYTASQSAPVRGLAACFVCFAFILTAGTYMDFSYLLASPVRAAALFALFLLLLTHPFPSAGLDEPDHDFGLPQSRKPNRLQI